MVKTPFGTRLAPGAGQLDEVALQTVADLTGGTYFRARDTASLLRAHALIDEMERTEGESLNIHPTRVLFYWPLGVAFLGVASLMILAAIREWMSFRAAKNWSQEVQNADQTQPWRASSC